MMAVADNPMHHDACLRLLDPSAWAREALRASDLGWPLPGILESTAKVILGHERRGAHPGGSIVNSGDKLSTPAQIHLEQAISKEDDDK